MISDETKPDSEIITRGIRVQVMTEFNEEQSDPENNHWLYLYRVTICNESSNTVKLLGRHWYITDSDGKTHEIIGTGVVGEQPIIEPGQQYAYTSACPLTTELGSMHGHYQMITEKEEKFDAMIAPFTLLSQPHLIH